jgi:hypothetical protein
MEQVFRRSGIRRMPVIVLAALSATASLVCAAEPADSSATASAASTPSQQELLNEVRALRAEVDQLKADQTAKPANAVSAPSPDRDVAATKAAVEKDADANRPFSFADAAAITGYDGKGFVLSDESGNNVLRPGYILQVRNVAEWRQNGKTNGPASQDDFEDGWEVRRAKFYFTGNLFSPDLTYRFQMANQVNGPSFALDDAWAAYNFYKGSLGKFAFKVGQFKVPVDHEEFEVGDEKQLTAERSLVNDILGGGAIGPRSQGIDLLWNSPKDSFHAETMIHDGSGNVVGGGAAVRGNTPVNAATTAASSLNTNFTDGKAPYSPIFGTAVRGEWLAFGDWKNYIDFTARAVDKDLLVLGGGMDYTDAVDASYVHAELDAQFKTTSAFSFYLAGLADYTGIRNVAGVNHNFDYGGLLQVAYAWQHQYEPFFRVDAIKLDDVLTPDHNLISEFTLGMNYYLGDQGSDGHHAKVTLDGSYLPVGPGPVNRLNEDELFNAFRNEFLIQAQFQLWL